MALKVTGKLKIWVPQGSVLDSLLYDIFINGIFWFANQPKACKYADDTIIFTCHPDLNTVIRQLEDACSFIIKLFSDSLLKLNDEKWHLIIFCEKTQKQQSQESQMLGKVTIKITGSDIWQEIKFQKTLWRFI